ncbi:hypothetical protein SBA_ch1_17610 [Sphingomonas bisphenolicum]|uniref:Uncharacterized protein n=1 Tax=Sphingomonas bisphenolicum TaxID=296544 RepID=A0ABM7G4E6_9SPHN|nr:hypothetical protein SBA_ch1_17610 [Sphingomonas bisphenolicum]
MTAGWIAGSLAKAGDDAASMAATANPDNVRTDNPHMIETRRMTLLCNRNRPDLPPRHGHPDRRAHKKAAIMN